MTHRALRCHSMKSKKVPSSWMTCSGIQAKLDGAGCRHAVFDEGATEAILNASDGTPRVLNRLCCQSLLCADAKKLDLVDADTVMQAINDCELG